MDYYGVEASLQALVEGWIPLSKAQNRHISQACMAVLLAGSCQLSRMARWLKQPTQQDSRVQWLRRLLETPYLTQERVYYPFVKQALTSATREALHLVMDRTHLADPGSDMLGIHLNFRQRAIPLVWQCMAHGSSDYQTQIALIERCRPLLPAKMPVVFHADGEFDSVALLQYLHQQHWDFIVGQSGKKHFRRRPQGGWQALSTLPVTSTKPVYLSNIELTRRYAYGPLNLFAFYQPRYHHRQRQRERVYCVTSLPIAPTLRRLGQRRWGIEGCFKDFKSSGWQLQASGLTHPARREGLLTILSLVYLWTTCLGRWLCKTGQRRQVDAKTQRHLSLFRIGWDWLVHCYQMDLPCPALLTLYQ
jgi:hypothetical protein